MAISLADLTVKIGADVSEFESKLSDMGNKIQSVGSSMTSMGTRMAAGITLPLLGVGAAALKVAGDMEQNQVAFEVMLGSAEQASTMLKDLRSFANTTPFEFPEVVDAAKNMVAFGFSADSVQGNLRMLGDVAAGLNIPLNEITEIYGKMHVQGRIQQEDINQLAGRGIPIYQALAKVMNTDTASVRELVSKGKVGFAELEKAFQSMTDEGSQFGGMMQKQSDTFMGRLSTLKDAVTDTLLQVGNALLPLAKTVMENFAFPLLNAVNQAAKAFATLPQPIQLIIVAIAGLAAAAGPVLIILGMVVSALGGLVTAAAGVIGAVAGISLPFIALAAAVGVVLIAIAGVIAAFVYLLATNEGLRNSFFNLLSIVWDVVNKGFKLLMDIGSMVIPVIMQIVNAILSFLLPVFQGWIDGCTQIWTTIQAYWPQIEAAVVGAVQNILNAVQPLVDAFTKLAPIVGQMLGDAFRILGDLIANYIIPYLPTLITLIGEGLSNGITMAVTVITTLGNILIQVAQTAFPLIVSAAQFLLGVFQAVWPTISTLVTVAIGIVVGTITTGVAVITAAWNTLMVLVTIATTIWNAISGVITAAVGIIVGIITAFVSTAAGVLTAGFNVLASIAQSAWNTISNIISSVINTIVSIISSIAGRVGDFMAPIVSTASSTINSLIGIVQGVVNTVVGILNGISNTINGITGGINGLIGTAQSVAGAIGGILPKFAEGGYVRRPTLAIVGEAGGEYIIPESKMAKFIQSFLANMGLGIPRVPSNVQAVVSSSTSTAGGKNVTVVIELDGQTIAKATAPYTERMIRMRQGIRS